jgi:hypothetical protein
MKNAKCKWENEKARSSRQKAMGDKNRKKEKAGSRI